MQNNSNLKEKNIMVVTVVFNYDLDMQFCKFIAAKTF